MKQPIIIGIGGAHSGSGKTTLAVAILKAVTSNIKNSTELKVTSNELDNSKFKIQNSNQNSLLVTEPALSLSNGCSLLNKKWGAIKYTRTAFYSSIIDDINILRQKDKDTKRLLDAGAEEVLWVQTPVENIEEVIPLAVARLSGIERIIVEGNSAIEFLRPDIVIFIFKSQTKRIKPSARAVFEHADIIVCDNVSAADKLIENRKPQPQIFSLSSLDIKELIISMGAVIQKKEIARHLKANASLNEISCSLVRKIAEDLCVNYSDVGKAADELEIKIRNCELGCF